MAQLTEGIVDRLLLHLRANLPARIAALNDEFADDPPLDPPPQGAYYAGLQPTIEYPAVFVSGLAMVVERYNRDYTDATHEVAIAAAIRGTDRTFVERGMYRYGRAIWEIVVDRFFRATGDDYATVANDNHRGGREPELVFEAPDTSVTGPLIGRVTLTCTFNKQEDN